MLNLFTLLKPNLVVSTAAEVTPTLLNDYKKKAVLVDLDDTLVASGNAEIDSRYREWFKELGQANIPVLLLSNGTKTRVAKWSQELEVDGLALIGKPCKQAFKKGLNMLGTTPSETVMIGDQLFTDILGANRSGIMSILVKPLSAGLLHTKAIRHLEKRILKSLGGV